MKEVLGWTGEWLRQSTLAIRARAPLEVLRDTIQPFPTFSGIYNAALKALNGQLWPRNNRPRKENAGHRADQAPPLSSCHSGPGICCPSGVPHWLRKTTSSTGVRCATAHRPTG